MSYTIPLSRGKVTIVDKADADVVLAYSWFAQTGSGCWYAARMVYRSRTDRTTQPMHRLLTGWPLVDHINGNGLDNRRSNLRPATSRQNQHNRRKPDGCSSIYKGVYLDKRRNRWVAMIRTHQRRINLGSHADEHDAALAYDAAARIHFGEFAALNFPRRGESSAHRPGGRLR